MSEKINAELLERIKKLPAIDTHEHMTYEKDFLRGEYDFTSLMNYIGLDVGMAGFTRNLWGAGQSEVKSGGSVDEKWQRIKPFWDYVRTGTYGRAYRRTLKIFFDVDDLDDKTVHQVSEKIKDYQYAGVYDEYIHDRYKIRAMITVDGYSPAAEPEHFVTTFCVDEGLPAHSRKGLGEDPPKNFDEYCELLQNRVQTAAENGAVALKIGGLARQRPLDFVEHSPEEIEKSYQYLLDEADGDWLNMETMARLKPFEDAHYWATFETAGELGLPVQIHSGLEFSQPWDGRPTCLIPTLIRFPETNFAIFHGSYPHMAELTGLARSFANVYLDLAWFHLLSHHQARAWLAEWLDVLPHNKIFAFGGDVFLFFGICSHLEIARENMASVLAQRVVDGLCDIDEAEVCARRLFHDNPWNTFAFENWKENNPG
jgi:uncharacterized protein